MTRLSIIAGLLIGAVTCGPEPTESVAMADRPHDVRAIAERNKPVPSPVVQQAVDAWKVSLDAEAGGEFEDALEALQGLPLPQRQGYMARFRSGWLLYRLGRYKDSAAAYAAAASLEPASVEARVGQTLPLMALKQWNDVAAVAQEVLRRDPENYLALQRLAYAKFSSQHFPEAELLYRHLVQLYPGDIEMRASLGWAVLRMGKQAEAVALFTQVLEFSPSHPHAGAGMTEALRRKRGR